MAGGRLARSLAAPTVRTSNSEGGGFYDRGDDPASEKILERVAEIAEKRGWPMSHVGLAWLNRRVVAPIIGFSTPERMDEALGALGKELTSEEEAYLEELYMPRRIQGHS